MKRALLGPLHPQIRAISDDGRKTNCRNSVFNKKNTMQIPGIYVNLIKRIFHLTTCILAVGNQTVRSVATIIS